jgi:hypothetical protein
MSVWIKCDEALKKAAPVLLAATYRSPLRRPERKGAAARHRGVHDRLEDMPAGVAA